MSCILSNDTILSLAHARRVPSKKTKLQEELLVSFQSDDIFSSYIFQDLKNICILFFIDPNSKITL